MTAAASDLRYLNMAARLAARGHGGAEPNPLVGCVIVDDRGETAGWGYHRRCGGPHAEIVALGRAGTRAAGATAYVTLEPCNHHGRTGPCTEALIEAGVARVVFARADPDPAAGGGAERLRGAGVDVQVVEGCRPAVDVSGPFARRVRLGLPWVTVKWAQTVDGRIATRSGRSRWISGAASRRLVHRERGRVDVVLTGIGTVLADDPRLTARNVRRRRTARRVVIDPGLRIPHSCRLVAGAREAPVLVVCADTEIAARPREARALEDAGVEVLPVAADAGEIPLETVLRELVTRYDATHVLVEAGAGLCGRLLRDGLANELWVFVAPLVLGDEHALPPAAGLVAEDVADARRLELRRVRRRGDDVLLVYGVRE